MSLFKDSWSSHKILSLLKKGRYQWLRIISSPGTYVTNLYTRSAFFSIVFPFLKCGNTFIDVCIYPTDTHSAQEENSGPYTITIPDY